MQVVMQYYISRCNKAKKKKGTKNKSSFKPEDLMTFTDEKQGLLGRQEILCTTQVKSFNGMSGSVLGLGDKVESSQTVSINKGRSVVLYPYAVKNIK